MTHPTTPAAGGRKEAIVAPTLSTLTTLPVFALDGARVRAWVNGTLVLIGTEVSVTAYAPGLVKVAAKGPFAPAVILEADTPAHLEPSGAWTITA